MNIQRARHRAASLFMWVACRIAKFIRGTVNPETLYVEEPIMEVRLVRGTPRKCARPDTSHYGTCAYNPDRDGKHEFQKFLEG